MVGFEIFYRYRDQLYASSLDEFDEPVGPSTMKLICEEYKVIKRTEKSALLVRWFGAGSFIGIDKKWMRLNAKKVFASPEKRDALHHFIKRKERQAQIYKARLDGAINAKHLALNEIKNLEKKDAK